MAVGQERPDDQGLPQRVVRLNAVDVSTIATLWTPDSGTTLILDGMSFTVSADGSVLFEDNAAAAGNFVFATGVVPANTPYTIFFPRGLRLSAKDNVLKGTGSASLALTGTLFGRMSSVA